jgi:hypothetical protein
MVHQDVSDVVEHASRGMARSVLGDRAEIEEEVGVRVDVIDTAGQDAGGVLLDGAPVDGGCSLLCVGDAPSVVGSVVVDDRAVVDGHLPIIPKTPAVACRNPITGDGAPGDGDHVVVEHTSAEKVAGPVSLN